MGLPVQKDTPVCLPSASSSSLVSWTPSSRYRSKLFPLLFPDVVRSCLSRHAPPPPLSAHLAPAVLSLPARDPHTADKGEGKGGLGTRKKKKEWTEREEQTTHTRKRTHFLPLLDRHALTSPCHRPGRPTQPSSCGPYSATGPAFACASAPRPRRTLSVCAIAAPAPAAPRLLPFCLFHAWERK